MSKPMTQREKLERTWATNAALRAENDILRRERDAALKTCYEAGIVSGMLHKEAKDEVAALRAELAEDDALRQRMSTLLTDTAGALKGRPEPLHHHDWSDLPKVAAALRARLEAAERAARAIKIAVAPDFCGGTDFWDSHTPDEIRDEGVRRFNATVDAITDTQRRVNEELRAALDERTRAVALLRDALELEACECPDLHGRCNHHGKGGGERSG